MQGKDHNDSTMGQGNDQPRDKRVDGFIMQVIEILIYGLGMLEFPYDSNVGKCQENASLIYQQNGVEYISEIDPDKGLWAGGDYWLGEDGKRYRLAGHRCIDKETGKEIGRNRGY